MEYLMTNPNDMFIAGIQALAQQMSNAQADDQGIKRLGEVAALLRDMPPAAPIVLDTGGSPEAVDSYRGYYERLAISSGDPTTVGAFLGVLEDADGRTFHGYKGGQYRMDSGTYLHVAEYGDCGRAVVGVSFADGIATIQTADEEW